MEAKNKLRKDLILSGQKTLIDYNTSNSSLELTSHDYFRVVSLLWLREIDY